MNLFVLRNGFILPSFCALPPRRLQVRLSGTLRVHPEHRNELLQVVAVATWASGLRGAAYQRFETSSAIEAFKFV
jgi:hypothetical protein